jgi:mono/diheme cytochrome c family protein
MRMATIALTACAMTMTMRVAMTSESAEGSRTTIPAKPKAQAGASSNAEMARGKATFDLWCAGCHGPMPGTGMFPPAGTYRLQQRYKGAVPAVLEERVDLTPELIRTVVRRGVGVMPPTRKTEVTDADLDALVAYLVQKKSK